MKLIQNNNIPLNRFLFAFILMLLSTATLAVETVYISDNLRVGVRTDPQSNDLPIGVVFTGMRMDVLDRMDGYVKIKTDKGITGWVKDIYVTKTPPAIIQLNKLQVKHDSLTKELTAGHDTTGELEKANVVLNEQLDNLKKQQREWQRERAMVIATQYTGTSWFWFILIIVIGIAGFVSGALWYRSQAMKRLGGLRV